MKFATKAIHTPFNKEDSYGALRMPVYDNAAFETKDAETLEEAFRGIKPLHTYSRISNPTVEYFENVIKNLTGSLGVIALSSGMAATSNVFFAIAQAGDNFITSKNLFGNTYSFFEDTLKPFGVSFKYADLTHPENIEELIDANTRGIFLETITNPQLEVADIKKISEVAKKHNLIVIADSTITPLCFFDAKELGINIEVISSTKYISGGATSMGGIIIDHGTFDWNLIPKFITYARKYNKFAFIAKLRKEVFRNTGACLSAHNAYLQTLGLETFYLRIKKSCQNAQVLAEWFEKQKLVVHVNYPGLASSPFHQTSKQEFGTLHGALLTINLSDKEYCYAFMNNLKLIRRATNLNDNKTLIIHPASTIYCEYPPEVRLELGVSDTLIRLAVGIEEPEDLIEDLSQSFNLLLEKRQKEIKH